MREASMDRLKDLIVRPDIDKHLYPLMLYRGGNNMKHFGRVTRFWNFIIMMMESEVETYSQAAKLARSPDYAHLCGPRRPPMYGQFPSFFGRLLDHSRVTDNIPGLTDYVRAIPGAKYNLTPISEYTNDPGRKCRNFAPWRINDYSPEIKAERAANMLARTAAKEAKAQERIRKAEAKRQERLRERILKKDEAEKLFYPYLIHKPTNGDAERALLMDVHNAVPKHLPEHIRADVCQDLIVAILAGDISRDEIKDNVRGYMRKVLNMHPLKYGPLSLDDVLPGTTIRRIDTLPSDVEHW